MKRFVSWNVNGIRACVKKNFLDSFNKLDADIFCIQETKLQEGQIELELEGYHQFWNYAEKKGYSGTAIFTKENPLDVIHGIGSKGHDSEGRAITLEFENFFIVNVYVPNAQPELKRLDFRMDWENKFKEYLLQLNEKKPVIFCGDLNVAHTEIDLKNPKPNVGNPGFSNEEREKFSVLLSSGFTDTFRHFYPQKKEMYSWWSYRFKAREKNAGWRIDYFCCSNSIKDNLLDAKIHTDIFGSDHCPVEVLIEI